MLQNSHSKTIQEDMTFPYASEWIEAVLAKEKQFLYVDSEG
jgi:hypothetical protein